MGEEANKAINELLDNLSKIPTDVTSELNMKDLVRQLENQLKKELRGRTSYVGG